MDDRRPGPSHIGRGSRPDSFRAAVEDFRRQLKNQRELLRSEAVVPHCQVPAKSRAVSEFAAAQRQSQLDAGVPAERAERGIASQVGLARRCSAFHARRYLGWSKILTTELPCTFAALRDGKVTEWRAMIVARETAWLSREHRAAVDAELAPRLETLGDRRVEAEAKTP